MINATRPTRRAGRANPYLLAALVALPLAGLGLFKLLQGGRPVDETEMVGLWQVAVSDITAPPALQPRLAGLTNQWLALGSRGTCWFHAPSPSSPWRGQATWEESISYGNGLSPVQWPGGPPTPAAAPPTNEPPRRKAREINPPILRWTYHTRPSGSRSVAMAQIVVERDGRLDGNITVEAIRAGGGVQLNLMTQPPEGKVDIPLRKAAALDIDADSPATPAAEPPPAVEGAGTSAPQPVSPAAR